MKNSLIFKDEFVQLYNCDSRLFKDDKRTVDLVFADPPFGMNLDEFEFMLFDFETRINGHTFLMSNERHLAKLIVKYDVYFRRLFCVDTVVPNMINSKTPMTQTDFIAEFRMLGKENNKFINLKDGFTSLIRANKNRHLANCSGNFDKGVKVFGELFKHYTEEGDLILDPFCGSGKSLVVARMLKRKIIGFEINKKSANHAKMLLQQRELF
jgi:DNA modification methylase